MTTYKNTSIDSKLNFIYGSALYQALELGCTRERAEDIARAAVKDYYDGKAGSNG